MVPIPFRNRDQSSGVSSYSKPSYLSSSTSAAIPSSAEGEYSDYSKRVSETLARHGQQQQNVRWVVHLQTDKSGSKN